MENDSQPNKHKRGSSPHETVEEVYRSWLKRPEKKVITPKDEESQAKTETDPPSKSE